MSTIKVNKIENTATADGGIAIDASGHVQIDGQQLPTAGALSSRNRIINGAMVHDQRNAGSSVTINSSNALYSLDRFQSRIEQATAAMTVQQSTTAPAGHAYSLLHTVTNTTAPAAGNRVHTRQIIEGYNIADLGWGSANAQTITLSFWVRSSVTGLFGVGFINSAENRSYVGTYTVNTADTFEYKTITVDGDTSGTWLTNNSNGIRVTFDLGSGTNFNATSADAWEAKEACRTSSCVNFQQNSGATLYLTGVQLEVGEKATPFEHRSYGDELARSERYYQVAEGGYFGPSVNGANNAGKIYFRTVMRAAATVTHLSALRNLGSWTVGAPIGFYMTTDGARYAHPYKGAGSTAQDTEFWDRYSLSAEL